VRRSISNPTLPDIDFKNSGAVGLAISAPSSLTVFQGVICSGSMTPPTLPFQNVITNAPRD
jgi:hypothetical protein